MRKQTRPNKKGRSGVPGLCEMNNTQSYSMFAKHLTQKSKVFPVHFGSQILRLIKFYSSATKKPVITYQLRVPLKLNKTPLGFENMPWGSAQKNGRNPTVLTQEQQFDSLVRIAQFLKKCTISFNVIFLSRQLVATSQQFCSSFVISDCDSAIKLTIL